MTHGERTQAKTLFLLSIVYIQPPMGTAKINVILEETNKICA